MKGRIQPCSCSKDLAPNTRQSETDFLLPSYSADTGAQPLVSDDGKLLLAVNGEIYNHRQLRKGLKDQSAVFKTHSDCEVIMHLVRFLTPHLPVHVQH